MACVHGFGPEAPPKLVFPSIFSFTREVPLVSGSESTAAQFVVGVAVAGQPARQLLVRIGAAGGIDLGNIGRILGELDDEPVPVYPYQPILHRHDDKE